MTGSVEPQKNDQGWVHHVLLALTLALIAVQPIGAVAGGIFTRVLLGALIVGCMATVYGRRPLFLMSLLLGVPAAATLVFAPIGGVGSAGLALGIATLGFICVVLLLRIFRHPAVSAASVSGSLVVYLLLGTIWWMAYSLAEALRPGSFYGLAGGAAAEVRQELFYFSYVTLTTLGYGDIGPVGPAARALAISEAVVGQLYLVVLVASLVGMFLNERSRSTD